ncbi:hypothetical protein HELRODRAFT_191787 [Helobdella robusta]|uniref:Alpha-2-macroglobulin domain-containing protein n=1 Tax=Helobdella robusta TaxID=6412 RepID=T1FTB7_HELRO|nr:hypothetical protein HELRODRAFT_191787 [Helobdella robusta]ESO03866.1 hypothetical protein HELRODRAFT_191787 [Helobdella robusta]
MSKFGSSSSYWYDYRDDGIYIPPAHFTDTDELFNSLNLVTFTSSLIYKYRYVHEEVFDSASDYAEEAPAPMAVRESFAGKKSLSSTTTHASHYNLNSNNNNMDSPTPREDFPETWIWSDLTVDENGRQKLELKVPDTITSWSASAFATHSQMGLGVVDGPVEVKVAKPLFVSLNLPYSITRGEEFPLQANVFNYFDQDVEVVVKLPQSDYFKTRSCDIDLKQLQSVNLSKTVKISRNSAGSVYFWIVPTKLGQIPLFVSAHAGFAADAVKELILVKPEGVEKNYETTSFFKTSFTEPQQFTTNISVPDDYVEGSAVVEVSAIGDILAPTLRNLGNLVRFPSGCGEQNMVNFAPNVHILKYMKAVDQLDELKEKEILNGLQSGYQRQLTYKRNDGSYSAFGNDDAAGSVWLSAFVLKSFRQAQAYIPVTNESLVATVKWLLKHQHVDGYFLDPPLSRIIHSKMQGGANSRISVTAYTLIALHENKALHASKVNVRSSIRKATQYLEREFVHYNDDPYVLGIVAYAFYCVGSSKMERVLNKLYSFAITEDEKTHWKQPMPHDQEEDAWLLKEFASPYDIELTSYVLLLRASQKNLNLSLPIARWLIGQMSGIGGFVSTQDTVLALEALTKFAPLVAFKDDSEGIKIKILGEYGEKHKLATINKDNLLVLQTVQLNDKTRKILAFAEGDGFALLQTSVRYSRLNLTNSKFLRLDVSAETHEHYLNLTVSTSWIGEEQSGMVLLEINLPTGFALKDQDEFKQKLKLTDFRNLEITPQKIVIYLSELNHSATEFNTTLEQLLAVHDVKPALVQVYRYYQPNEKVSAFYSPEGKKSWVSSCPQCCGTFQ